MAKIEHPESGWLAMAVRRGVLWAVLGSLLGSFVLELQIVHLLELMPLFSDFLRAWRYFAIGIALPLAGLALLVELLAALICRGRAVAGRAAATTVLGCVGGSFVALVWVLAQRPFGLFDTSIYIVSLVIVLVALLVAYGLARVLVTRRRGTPLWLAPACLFLLLVGAAWYLRLPEASGDPEETAAAIVPSDRRTLLLGVDGATWRVIDPMLKREELPNLARLLEEGTRGTLISTVSPIQPFTNSASGGMRSPVLWSTVITGRAPRDHGVLDMEVTFLPGLSEPVPFRIPIPSAEFHFSPSNAAMRRVKSLWQIFTEYGKTVGSLAWWPSWPIEEVNGFVVSDRYRGEDEGGGRVLPEDFVQRYDLPTLAHAFDIANVFVPCGDEELDLFSFPRLLRRLFGQDNLAMVLGPIVAEREEWDFLSIYVKGPDVVQHSFWEYHDPTGLEATGAAFLADFDPVEAVYRHVDDMLGSLIAALDERTNLLIVSDHGAGAWLEEHSLILDLWSQRRIRSKWSGNHRPDGVFIAWGPDVRPGGALSEPVSLLDLAPTALYLMGFPVADDMPGKVLLEALQPAVVQSRPVARTSSYETASRRRSYYIDPELDSDIEAELRSLGYLN